MAPGKRVQKRVLGGGRTQEDQKKNGGGKKKSFRDQDAVVRGTQRALNGGGSRSEGKKAGPGETDEVRVKYGAMNRTTPGGEARRDRATAPVVPQGKNAQKKPQVRGKKGTLLPKRTPPKNQGTGGQKGAQRKSL